MSHPFFSRLPISGLVGAAALSAGIALAPAPASAICLSGSLDIDGTNCTLFNPSTDSQATNKIDDPGLNQTPFAQMGFRTDAALADVQITGIGWSQDDGATWTLFNPSSLGPIGSSYVYTNPFDFTPKVGTPLLTRFTIESGSSLVTGNLVQSILVASAINTTDVNGRLNESSRVGDIFVQTSRDQESVPGPLPLLGASAAFGYSRRLRRRLKAGTCG